MAVSKVKKQAIYAELTSEIAKQKAVVLLTTKDAESSLNSASNFELRKKSYDAGVKIQVIKNTLINKAFESVPTLVGPTYIAYMLDIDKSDEVTVPKIMVELISKTFKSNFNVVGAVVNGEYYNPSKTVQLSKVSTHKESMARIAGSLNQITAKIAIAVKEVPASIARGVDAYSKTL